MARVTVEDCMNVVENRFELVIIAGQRAKDIACGSKLTVARDNDKNPVIALREIAQETVLSSALREAVIKNLQKRRSTFDLQEDQILDSDNENEDGLKSEFMEDVNSISVKDFDFEESDDFSFEDGDIESDDQ